LSPVSPFRGEDPALRDPFFQEQSAVKMKWNIPLLDVRVIALSTSPDTGPAGEMSCEGFSLT
jgi:hypothetical protein